MEWNAAYELGHLELDAEHRSLFEVLRSILTGFCDLDLLDSQIKLLEHYITVHFDREERLMSETGYPFLAEHKRQHDGFRHTVASIRNRLAPGDLAATRSEMIAALSNWLSHHIIDSDHDYKDWVVPETKGPPSRS